MSRAIVIDLLPGRVTGRRAGAHSPASGGSRGVAEGLVPGASTKRTRLPIGAWPSRQRSASMTVPIFGYPPEGWASRICTIGWPPCGTWMTPGTMPCERSSIGATRLEFVAGQPVAVAVALRRDLPGLGPERVVRGGREVVVFGRGQNAHRRQAVHLEGKSERRRDKPKPAATLARPIQPREYVALAEWTALDGRRMRRAAACCASRARSGRRFRRRRTDRRGSPRHAACLRDGRASEPARLRRGAPTRAAGARRRACRAVRAGEREVTSHSAKRTLNGKTGISTPAASSSLPSRMLPQASASRSMAPDVPTPKAAAPRCGRDPARSPEPPACQDLDHRSTRTALKRMLSPGLQQRGRSCARASKKTICVLPIVFQPLGPSDAETPV